MILEFFCAGGRNAQVVVDVSRLVVKDDHGNPIGLAVAHTENQTFIAHTADDDFETLLDALGLKAATIVRRIHID